MQNNRDDEKYESPEESEYHFSDEDVSYEVETGAPKTQTNAAPKENIFTRLTRSKRMLISLGIFLVLVFIVYKIVAPTSSVPNTEITPPVAQAPVQSVPMTSPPSQAMQQKTVVAPPPVVQPPVAANVPPPPVTQPPVMQIPAPSPAATLSTPPPGAVQPTPPAMVTAPPSTAITTTTTTTAVPPVPTVTVPNLPANAEQAFAQLQAEYNQRVNDFAVQNKALQEQLQTLTARVLTMETEMNQLIRALTRQTVAAPPPPPPPEAVSTDKPAPEARLSYTVQAIIPGRAWLKSASGDTVTVAEGDVVRGLGRVTKIDPYDGVVEINTGNKVVSLAYGSGG